MKKLQGGQKKATFDHNKRTFDDGVMKMTASASKPNQSPSPPVIGLWICWCLLALLEPVESHPSHQGKDAQLIYFTTRLEPLYRNTAPTADLPFPKSIELFRTIL